MPRCISKKIAKYFNLVANLSNFDKVSRLGTFLRKARKAIADRLARDQTGMVEADMEAREWVEAANRHAVELGKKYAADEAEKRAREKSESANREASRLARLAALADAALLLFAAWPTAIKTYMLEDAMAGDTKIEIKDTTGFET